MINIEANIKAASKKTRERNKQLRCAEHTALVDVTNDMEAAMCAKGFDVSTSSDVATATLSLHLRGKQSLKNMRPFLKQIAKTRLFQPASYTPYASSGYVSWMFRTKSEENQQQYLHLTVWLGTSVSCKRVSTGRFTEEFEYVCDPIPDEELVT